MVKGRIRVNSHFVFALLPLLLVVQAVIPARIWYYMLATLIALIVLSFFWTKRLRDKVTLERRVHRGIVQVGDMLEERFTLTNDSIFPLLWAEIQDQSYMPGYDPSRVEAVGSLDENRWRSRGTCLRRGLFEVGATQMRLGDPFGFFTATIALPATATFMVYPPVVELPDIELPRGVIAGNSLSSIRSPHVTTNAFGVRQYVHGDSLSRIHWPTSARMDELFSKEFEVEPSGDLWLVLDLERQVQAGEEAESTHEYGIILAASLASRLIKEGRGVGMVAHDRKVTAVPLDRGYVHLWRIMQALVMIRELGEVPLEGVLAGLEREVALGSSLMVITPSCDPRWIASLRRLANRGIMPMVVLMDAASFGGEANVRGMRSALEEEGIPGYLVGHGFQFAPLWLSGRHRRLAYRAMVPARPVPLVAG